MMHISLPNSNILPYWECSMLDKQNLPDEEHLAIFDVFFSQYLIGNTSGYHERYGLLPVAARDQPDSSVMDTPPYPLPIKSEIRADRQWETPLTPDKLPDFSSYLYMEEDMSEDAVLLASNTALSSPDKSMKDMILLDDSRSLPLQFITEHVTDKKMDISEGGSKARLGVLNTTEWTQSLGEQISYSLLKGTQHVSIRLTPWMVGEIGVHLRMNSQQLMLHFVVENNQIKDALEYGMFQLKQTLTASGINLAPGEIGISLSENIPHQEQRSSSKGSQTWPLFVNDEAENDKRRRHEQKQHRSAYYASAEGFSAVI